MEELQEFLERNSNEIYEYGVKKRLEKANDKDGDINATRGDTWCLPTT